MDFDRYMQSPSPDTPIDSHDLRVAKVAIQQVFAILGVDINNPKEVEEFRKDLRFGGTLRRRADRGIMALIGVVVTLFGTALYFGFVDYIKDKLGGGS